MIREGLHCAAQRNVGLSWLSGYGELWVVLEVARFSIDGDGDRGSFVRRWLDMQLVVL